MGMRNKLKNEHFLDEADSTPWRGKHTGYKSYYHDKDEATSQSETT